MEFKDALKISTHKKGILTDLFHFKWISVQTCDEIDVIYHRLSKGESKSMTSLLSFLSSVGRHKKVNEIILSQDIL